MHKQILEGDPLQNLTLENITPLLLLYHHHNHHIELKSKSTQHIDSKVPKSTSQILCQ
jgi:hypothetical protein